MADTNPSGSEALNVSTAAEAFLGLMGDDEGADSQPELEQDSEEVTVDETDESDDSDESQEYEDEDEDESDEPKPEPTRYKVKAAGEEVEVELDELIAGYQRSKDYTQKSQTLAEARKSLETQQAQVAEIQKEREAYSQRLTAIDNFLAKQEVSRENIAEMKETDPIGYAIATAEQYERDKQREAVRVEQAGIAEKQRSDHSAGLQAHLQRESQLLTEAIPEMAGEGGNKLKQEVMAYAKTKGYTDEQIGKLYDHRAVVALHGAMKWEALQKSKPEAMKRVQAAPKTLKAGTAPPSTTGQRDKQTLARLKQSGRIQDAAAAFERFL
jgi:hypothetical protein